VSKNSAQVMHLLI